MHKGAIDTGHRLELKNSGRCGLCSRATQGIGHNAQGCTPRIQLLRRLGWRPTHPSSPVQSLLRHTTTASPGKNSSGRFRCVWRRVSVPCTLSSHLHHVSDILSPELVPWRQTVSRNLVARCTFYQDILMIDPLNDLICPLVRNYGPLSIEDQGYCGC